MNVETKSKLFTPNQSLFVDHGENAAAWAQASPPPALVPGTDGSRVPPKWSSSRTSHFSPRSVPKAKQFTAVIWVPRYSPRHQPGTDYWLEAVSLSFLSKVQGMDETEEGGADSQRPSGPTPSLWALACDVTSTRETPPTLSPIPPFIFFGLFVP